jgi:hypothetical protein
MKRILHGKAWSWSLLLICWAGGMMPSQGAYKETVVLDSQETAIRLEEHLRRLTVEIGERTVYLPANLQRTASYLESFYQSLGIAVHSEPYTYRNFTVANVVARIDLRPNPSRHYLLGAHYDSVDGTVGADDNASGIAVQLETARQLQSLLGKEAPDVGVTFVSFALEEPPVFATRYMGSKIYAKKAKKERHAIDGMLCLEMVGYTCARPGCQSYPFPLMFMHYPRTGEFIGIVGDFRSRALTRAINLAFRNNPELPVVKLTVPLAGWMMPAVRLSDHASFWDQGFKAVMITDSAFFRNPHYHLPSDTMDKLDYRFMAELVKSLVLFFRSL